MAWHHRGDRSGSPEGSLERNCCQTCNLSRTKSQTLNVSHISSCKCLCPIHFRLPRGHRIFQKKMEITVMAPNHGGDPLGSILGPIGSKKGVKTVKKTLPQNSIFRLPCSHRFFQKKMEVTVMGPNHGGDLLRSILGPMGPHWVKKMGQNRKKLPCPKIRIFRLPRGHRSFAKNGSYGYGAKSRWGPPRVHLGANGVTLGRKIGSKP